MPYFTCYSTKKLPDLVCNNNSIAICNFKNMLGNVILPLGKDTNVSDPFALHVVATNLHTSHIVLGCLRGCNCTERGMSIDL